MNLIHITISTANLFGFELGSELLQQDQKVMLMQQGQTVITDVSQNDAETQLILAFRGSRQLGR